MNSAALMRDARLYMKVAGSLLTQIEDGTFKPGDPMPRLSELTTSFRVSRRTAGHAMQVLADEGPVQFFPGLGYFVCELP